MPDELVASDVVVADLIVECSAALDACRFEAPDDSRLAVLAWLRGECTWALAVSPCTDADAAAMSDLVSAIDELLAASSERGDHLPELRRAG